MSAYSKKNGRARYDKFYRTVGWCDQDPAIGLDAEPDPCGPSMQELVERRQRENPANEGVFNPRWSPIRREVSRHWPLDFNR